MFIDFEILVDSDIKGLETKVKRKLSSWIPVSEITVIHNPKNYNEFALQICQLDPISPITTFMDYQIIVEQDLKRLESHIKRIMPNNWYPIGDIVVIRNHQGYNQFAIQVAEVDPNDPSALYGP